jgi:hypothetical protein
MKPGKTFNLSKTSKRMLATITDPHARGHWKKCMIDAELHEAVVPKTTRSDKGGRNNTPSGPAGTTGSHAYTTPAVVE